MPSEVNIADLRQSYQRNELLENNVSKNPLEQFHQWFQEAIQGGIIEPNAMVLSTWQDPYPEARVVLLKGLDELGFVFYTNYASHKGQQLIQHPVASLTFFWDVLERQIRIKGTVQKVSAEESDLYFSSRPRESQIGAWVSEQSQPISSRAELDQKAAQIAAQFADSTLPIPRPEHWGGFRVIPDQIEFWQGRPSRLHDRLIYTKSAMGWQLERWCP
ncbi:MAG: pyridoxamine 5'-phosphate oxidase [Spirosomataceae bacterium]